MTILIADDTVLLLSANSIHELTTKINQELESVDNWLKYNKLSLNYNKTQYMLFTKQNEYIDTNFNVQINNHLLSRTECVKYLGVIIDDKLIWKPHTTLVKKQVSKASGIICKLRHYQQHFSQHRRQAKCTAVPLQIVELSHSHATWLLVDNKSKIPLLNHQNSIEATVSTHTRKRQNKRLRIASVSSNIFEAVVANKA